LLGTTAKEIVALAVISLAGLLTLVSGIDYLIKNKHIITISK
jgi:hypothetical protein